LRFRNIILINLIIITSFSFARTLILPSEPNIRYFGRIDCRRADNYRFDWPGISIEAMFEGTSCAIQMNGAGEQFNVFIDDQPVKIIKTDSAMYKVYDLASGLKDTVHRLLITKRFAHKNAVSEFKGIILDSGKTLLQHSSRPRYRIEFIGASTLNGFGNEASTLRCNSEIVSNTSNCYDSYGPVAARLLDAEYTVIALSSKGIVRNWASPYVKSFETFPDFYNRTLLNESELTWDYNKWIPHIVVVNLGTNDFSTKPHPPSILFKNYYWAFLQFIYQIYPEVEIICLTSDKEPLRSLISDIVRQEKAEGNERIHFFDYDPIPTHERGCDWHPNTVAHRKIARKLADKMEPILKRKLKNAE
jgi:hypothetical protein